MFWKRISPSVDILSATYASETNAVGRNSHEVDKHRPGRRSLLIRTFVCFQKDVFDMLFFINKTIQNLNCSGIKAPKYPRT